jgi:hypothetical protein
MANHVTAPAIPELATYRATRGVEKYCRTLLGRSQRVILDTI